MKLHIIPHLQLEYQLAVVEEVQLAQTPLVEMVQVHHLVQFQQQVVAVEQETG